jgi:hypothetical protein
MRRRTIVQFALISPAMGFAQTEVDARSIGIGPFEFPIAGRYSYTTSGGATTIAVAHIDRAYTVGMFRAPPAPEGSDRTSKIAMLIQASWTRFAREERGKIVREFKRTDIGSGLSILSMATEFEAGTQYYVQFAATTGSETAVLFAEGKGSAVAVLSELEPLVAQVRVVVR